MAVRFRIASSCTARNATYERTCIKHVEDREARKTTENNAIASTTLGRTESNRERERERDRVHRRHRLQGEPERASVARDDVLQSKSQPLIEPRGHNA